MDAVFVNKFKHTKSHYIEMSNGFSDVFPKLFWILSFLYTVIAVLMFIYCYDITPAIIILIFGIFMGIYPFIKNHILEKKRQKQFLTLYDEMPESITYFYENNFKTTTPANNAEITIDYDKIIKLKQTQNLYLLILKERLVIMVDKNRMENGTCEEFEKFIINKAVNAKNKL